MVSGALFGLSALLLVVGAGSLVAATLRIEGAAAVFLAVYVVGFTEIVGLSLLLSAFDALTRAALIAGVVLLFLSAAGAWTLLGAPRLRRIDLGNLKRLAGSRVCLVLAIAVAIGFAYVLALLLGTPPNGWDPLNYHLARVAFWLQAKRVGYIEPTYDERLNLNPPNAEIGSGFALGVTHDEVFTGAVQFIAALMCAVAVFGIARRNGLASREAAFGALLFLTLPIVVLQASLSKNDLVVASLLLAAAFFVLGRRTTDIVLGGIATALAVGTKTTALYGLAVLVLLVVTASEGRRGMRLSAVAVGALVGSYWYGVNLVETSRFFGDQSAQQHVTAVFHLRSNVVTAFGMVVDLFDVSGSRGKDVLIYVIAAAVVAAVAFARGRSRSVIVILALAAVPLIVLALSEHVGRPALVHLYNVVHDPNGYLAVDTPQASPTIASDTASWFGAVGLLGILAAPVLVRAQSRTDRVLAVAPLFWFALVALTLSYNPFLGRFFVFPVALSAVLWGRVLRWPPLAAGVGVLAAVTLALALVHYAEKPSGLRLLDRTPTASVWRMPRWEVQSQHDPALAPVLRFIQEHVPTHASIALALSDNGFGYPVFGPHLTRNVPLVAGGSNAREVPAQWLYASRDRSGEVGASCWKAVLESPEGSVFRRSAGCAPG
jgi:hypothetical protein